MNFNDVISFFSEPKKTICITIALLISKKPTLSKVYVTDFYEMIKNCENWSLLTNLFESV